MLLLPLSPNAKCCTQLRVDNLLISQSLLLLLFGQVALFMSRQKKKIEK